MAQEGEPRINTYSTSQSRGQKRCSVVQSNVPGSFVGMDKHYKDIRQERVPKYLREKLLSPH